MNDTQELLTWVSKFNQTTIPMPRLKSKEANIIWAEAMNDLEIILQRVEEQAEKLNED